MSIDTNYSKMEDLLNELDKHLKAFDKGVKVAAPRARKVLMEIAKLTKLMRGQITAHVKTLPKKQKKNKSDLTASTTEEETNSD